VDDPRVDIFELVHYCCDLLSTHSSRDLAGVLGLAVSEIPRSGNPQQRLFPDVIEVSSDEFYHRVRIAVATKSFFASDRSDFPTAVITMKNSIGQAQLKPLELDSVDRPSPEVLAELKRLMFRQRDELSDTDSDVWDYCNWKWLLVAESFDQFVTITLDEFLSMRGILKKRNGEGQRGGYKKSQKAKVLKSIVRLRNVLVDLFEFELQKPGSRSRRAPTEPIRDRAIKIEDGGQLNFDGDLPNVTSFKFRPGHIFARYLFGPGKQTALLYTKAIEYDPRTQSYEKRFSRYLCWMWRVRAYTRSYFQPFRVSAVLEAIHLPVNRRFPNRTFERFEKMLGTLETDGLMTQWQYENRPPDQSRKGWINDWLQDRVLIEPPQVIFDRYQSIGNKRPAGADVVDIGEFAELGELLKEKRSLANMSVMVAAQQCGVSPDEYLQAEQGRKPPVSVRAKLKTWLGLAAS
jgi:hypothetical protein